MTLPYFLVLSLFLLSCGIYTVITRKNSIAIFMGVELILNAANLNFVAFARFSPNPTHGQISAIFIIMIAAAEIAVALALILAVYRRFQSVSTDDLRELRE